ncbi:MAG: TrkH family potassium uptake protein [Desulfosudaceae bacterium]
MNWRVIINISGYLVLFLGLVMIFPLLTGLCFGESALVYPFLLSIVITSGCGGAMILLSRTSATLSLGKRESMVVVGLCWGAAGLFGALPFYFSELLPGFTDALFESVSGFTTTGASVLTDIESAPRGLLFWRSFIQWLGGMGIIVLSVAILPFLGVGGMQLYKAEVPSPVPDKLQPRISETAKTLWKVYLLFSLTEVVLLKIGGMNMFDAACHTFTTMPTGGFSTRNLSVGAYGSLYYDMIILVFMVFAGINFSLHYQMLRGRPLTIWRDAEGRFFLCGVAVLIVLVSFNLYGSVYQSIGQAMRYGSFQVVSIITTTGFTTADYETWPALSQLILFFCMFVGASAGSTGGGMKIIRIMLCFKYCYRELFSLIHPKAVSHVKIAGKTVPGEVMRSIMGFLSLYIIIFVVSSFLLAGMGVDAVTSIAAVAASLGNIGPGFAAVGPLDNFALIPAVGKWLLILCMLLGRLEIYTLIILLVPEFWRK